MNGSLAELGDDPDACCRWLNGELNRHGIHVILKTADRKMIVLGVTFDDVDLGEPERYPAEAVTIVVRPNGDVMALPSIHDRRTWEHRYDWLTLHEMLQPNAPILLGPLCLWFPDDPPHLRWHWSHGLAAYLLIVQRHLLAEEYYRRHHHWPVEDAPHGHRADGKPHPILDPDLRAAS